MLPVVTSASSALPGTEEVLSKCFSYEICFFSAPHLFPSVLASLFSGFSVRYLSSGPSSLLTL